MKLPLLPLLALVSSTVAQVTPITIGSIFFFVLPNCEQTNGAVVACMDIPAGQCCSFTSGSGFGSAYLSTGNPLELVHKGYEFSDCNPSKGRNGQIEIRTYCLSPGFQLRSSKWWRPKHTTKRDSTQTTESQEEEESNGLPCVAPNAIVLDSGVKKIPEGAAEEMVLAVEEGDLVKLRGLDDYYKK